MGRITHKKIAQIAGVSQSTVSKALAKNPEISGETLKKVIKIAVENGYFDHRENVVKSKNYRPYIAIVVPEIISLNYATEATMLVKALAEINTDGRIYIAGFNPGDYDNTLRAILYNNYTDGIISFCDTLPGVDITIPFTCITQFGVDLPYNLVSSNLAGGMKKALTYLVGLGHRNIGFIGETNTIPKEKLFIKTMSEMGLETNYIYTNDNRFESCGYNGILKMLNSEQMFPTAFICAYDEIAYGAINQLKLYGYSVPEDFSMIGMNDVVFSKVLEPELTTIVINSDELCSEAIKLLGDNLYGGQKAVKHIEVQCGLAVRKSTGKPRATDIF